MMQARIRQASLVAVIVVASVVLLAGAAFAQTNIGTWKQNVAKSKNNAGTGNKSGTIKTEAAGAGVKVTVDSVSADGTVRHWTYAANYDGKDSTITGNAAQGDVVVVTRVDANTTRSIFKNGGKVTVTQTSVVSGDKKTLTITSKGTNALGATTDSVSVWEKQ